MLYRAVSYSALFFCEFHIFTFIIRNDACTCLLGITQISNGVPLIGMHMPVFVALSLTSLRCSVTSFPVEAILLLSSARIVTVVSIGSCIVFRRQILEELCTSVQETQHHKAHHCE